MQLAGVLGGGIAPLIATKLLSVGGGNPYLIMIYIGSMAMIAIIATTFMPRDRIAQTYQQSNELDLKTKITEQS